MIIISSRKSFSNPDRLSDSGHEIKDINLSNDAVVSQLTSPELLQMLTNRKVLMLIHGYNNEQDEVHDAYAVIEQNVQQHLADQYDFVLGYSWPGGDQGLDWWASKRRANAVARRFRFLLETLSASAADLDLMSHSLGARVVLKALKHTNAKLVRNYYCTAPAVDNEVLERGEEFDDSVDKVESLYVFHSKKDGVLAGVYRVAELDNALGLYGPEDRQYILNSARNVYVANCKKRVESHGAYKRTPAVYGYILAALNGRKPRFKTL